MPDEKYTQMSQKTKEDLIRQYRLCNVDDTDWSDSAIEAFCDLAKEQGFDVEPANCSYTGFWSQGDGASFTCEISLRTYQEEYQLSDALLDAGMDVRSVRKPGSRYCHENTCEVELEHWGIALGDFTDYPEDLEKRLKALEETLESRRLTLSKKLFTMLEAQYTYSISDEQVWETIEANDYFGWEEEREPAYDRLHRALAATESDPVVHLYVASAWQDLQKRLVSLTASGFGDCTVEELLGAINVRLGPISRTVAKSTELGGFDFACYGNGRKPRGENDGS